MLSVVTPLRHKNYYLLFLLLCCSKYIKSRDCFSYCVCMLALYMYVCVFVCLWDSFSSPRPLLPTKRRSLKRATWFFITAEAFLSSAE